MPRSASLLSLLSRKLLRPLKAGQYSIVAGWIRLSIAAAPAPRRPVARRAGRGQGRAPPDVPPGRSTVVDSVTESTLAREKKMGK